MDGSDARRWGRCGPGWLHIEIRDLKRAGAGTPRLSGRSAEVWYCSVLFCIVLYLPQQMKREEGGCVHGALSTVFSHSSLPLP